MIRRGFILHLELKYEKVSKVARVVARGQKIETIYLVYDSLWHRRLGHISEKSFSKLST